MQALRRVDSMVVEDQGARSEMNIDKTMMLEEVAMAKPFNANE